VADSFSGLLDGTFLNAPKELGRIPKHFAHARTRAGLVNADGKGGAAAVEELVVWPREPEERVESVVEGLSRMPGSHD